jgi:hypothetical protein
MKAERPPRDRNTLNLPIDSTIFIAFLVATAPRFSGIAGHEWLSIAFAATAASSRARRPASAAASVDRAASGTAA